MTYARFLHALLVAAAAVVTACTTVPSTVSTTTTLRADAEASRRLQLYQRPPNRLYGLMLEQGSLDVEPDVAPMIEYQQQRMQERAAIASLRKAAPGWEELGPANNLGRVIDIAFHPQNSNIIYVSSPGGGVYKSVDAGDSWTKLAGLPYQPVNSIAIDPLNPNVVYFATGHYSGSGSDLLSLGVYKSTDAGATFMLLPATVPTTANTDWLRVTRVVVHPTVANLVFAGTRFGFFLSNDAGLTWTKVDSIETYDIAIDPNDPTRMLRGTYSGAVSYSANAGTSWRPVAIVPSTTTFIHTRVKFAKASPRVVYASVNQNDGEIHKSTDGGLTWSIVSTPEHLGSQGFHTNQLWVSPIDSNHLISGGVDLYKSLDGGVNFTKISNWQLNLSQTGAGVTPMTPHADHNSVASPPDYSAAKPVFFVGTDGGLFSTGNARTVSESLGWTKSGGPLSITQFVGSAGRRLSNGLDTLVGGTQDNGTIMNVGYQGWTRIASGDGGFAVVDPIDDVVFGEFQNGVVFRYNALGLRSICTGILDADPASCGVNATLKLNFYTPLEYDGAGGRLYVGGNSLWRSNNPKFIGPTWAAIKAPVTGTTAGTTSTNYINAMSIQQANPAIALVGHNDGQIFRSANLTATTPTWTALGSLGLPIGRAVGALYIDPEDANRLYVGYTGYFANNLWRSDDGGATWVSIATGLPPGSIYAITRHPQAKERLHVGTIWGTYGSTNGGLTWPVANDGPAATQVRKLFWLGNDTLVAGTFGNGMYRTIVSLTTPQNAVVEYYHPVLDNYFITADPVEQAAVDAGAAGAEWRRTGNTFTAGGPSKVCRFYGNARPNPATGAIFGPNSHFYTADAAECAGLKSAQNTTAKSWFFESNDFSTTPSINGACAAGLVPVYRAYNDGFARGIDSNHRITSSLAAIQQVIARGWKNEGIVMCAPS